MEHVALFMLGLVLLALGAPLLVFGAARLDRALGRSPFAVGIVAVAFGPCVAGLAFDLAVVLRPLPPRPAQYALAAVVGRLVGGCVVSTGLVLGLAALVRPIVGAAKLFYTAIPLAFGAALLVWFLAADKQLSRVDAGFLLAAFVVVAVVLVRAVKKEPEDVKAEFGSWVPSQMSLRVAALLALAGLAATVGGAILTATRLFEATRAIQTKTPEMGETIVSFGTQLPALVAAVLAARRGRANVALGITVGSVIFHLLLVVGVVAMVQPLPVIEDAIMNAIPAMALVMLLLLPVLFNGLRVPRWEGAILLAAYVAFVAWQVLRVLPAK